MLSELTCLPKPETQPDMQERLKKLFQAARHIYNSKFGGAKRLVSYCRELDIPVKLLVDEVMVLIYTLYGHRSFVELKDECLIEKYKTEEDYWNDGDLEIRKRMFEKYTGIPGDLLQKRAHEFWPDLKECE